MIFKFCEMYLYSIYFENINMYFVWILDVINCKLFSLSFYIWLINYSVCLLPYNGNKMNSWFTAPWPCGSFMCFVTDILLKWLLLKTFSAVMSCFDPSALTLTQQTHQRRLCVLIGPCVERWSRGRHGDGVFLWLSHTKPKNEPSYDAILAPEPEIIINSVTACHFRASYVRLNNMMPPRERKRCLSVFIVQDTERAQRHRSSF